MGSDNNSDSVTSLDSVISSDSMTSFEEDVCYDNDVELFAKLCIIVRAMGWKMTFGYESSSTNNAKDELQGIIIGNREYIDEMLGQLIPN